MPSTIHTGGPMSWREYAFAAWYQRIFIPSQALGATVVMKPQMNRTESTEPHDFSRKAKMRWVRYLGWRHPLVQPVPCGL